MHNVESIVDATGTAERQAWTIETCEITGVGRGPRVPEESDLYGRGCDPIRWIWYDIEHGICQRG